MGRVWVLRLLCFAEMPRQEWQIEAPTVSRIEKTIQKDNEYHTARVLHTFVAHGRGSRKLVAGINDRLSAAYPRRMIFSIQVRFSQSPMSLV